MTDERFRELEQAGNTGADLSPGDPLCKEAAEEITRLKNEMDGEILNHRAARDKLIYRESEIKLLREQLEEKNSRIDELTRKLGYRQGLCTPKPRA